MILPAPLRGGVVGGVREQDSLFWGAKRTLCTSKMLIHKKRPAAIKSENRFPLLTA